MKLEELKLKIFDHHECDLNTYRSFLDNELYEKSFYGSRFKEIYESLLEYGYIPGLPGGFTVLLCEYKDQPIAISVVEWIEENKIDLFTLKDPFKIDSKVNYKIDKVFKLKSVLGVYVKPAFRRLGIGGKICEVAEDLIIKRSDLDNNELPLVIAKGDAYKLVRDNVKHLYVLRHTIPYGNLNIDLSNLTYKYMSEVHDCKNFLNDSLKTFKRIENKKKVKKPKI
jgi:GNAT superfamily N-acetyltransferase